MGPLTLFTILALAAACSYLISRAYQGQVARMLAMGVWSYASIAIALQLLGAVATITSARCVAPIPLITLLAAECTAAWFWLRRRTAADAGSTDSSALHNTSNPKTLITPSILAMLALILLATAFVSGILAPPRGWDVLSYHLPRAVSWLQTGSLAPHGGYTAHYPGNGELLLLTLLFSGTDRLVPVVQVPFALLGTLAIFGISRLAGATRRSSALAALVFITMPIVVFQSALAKNDVVVVAMIVSSLYFAGRALLVAHERPRSIDIASAGIAMGLAVGARYPVLPLAFVLVAVLAVFSGRTSKAPTSREKRLEAGARQRRVALLCTGAILVTSAFWYLSNWFGTGNPLAPFGVHVGGVQVVRGISPADVFGEQQFNYVRSVADWLWFPLRDRALAGSYSAAAGFGPAFVALVVPAAVYVAVNAVRAKVRRGSWEVFVLLLVMTAVALVSWGLAGHRLPRYLLPAVAIPIPLLAVLIDASRSGWRRSLEVVLVVAVAFSSLETLRVFFAEDNLTSGFLGTVGREEMYQMPRWVDELPAGTTIALTRVTDHQYYQTFRYPLVGERFANRVIMEGDAGTTYSVMRDGIQGAHGGMVADGVDYLFIRAFGMEPCRTTFEQFPDLYEPAMDDVAAEYPWYRKGSPVLTKAFRVRRASQDQ